MYDKNYSLIGSLCEKLLISADSTVTHESEVELKK